MLHTVLIVICNVVVIGSMLAMCFFFLQNRLMYPAGVAYSNVTPDVGKNGISYIPLEVETEDKINLTGWFMHPAKTVDQAPTFVIMHEHLGGLSERMDIYRELVGSGANVFAFAYRGYSGNKGNPSESGLKKDADAIIKYLNDTKALDSKIE